MKNKQTGFTLLEILIALFIFVILAAVTTSGLRNILNVEQRTDLHAARLAELQMALTLWQRDVQQMINRTIMDESGHKHPGLVGDSTQMEFTHLGFVNPGMVLPRSNLQRVAYVYKNQQWLRVAWPELDHTADMQPVTRVLLTGVTNLHLGYRDNGLRNLYSQWPVIAELSGLPRVVELQLQLREGGSVTRIVHVPGG